MSADSRRRWRVECTGVVLAQRQRLGTLVLMVAFLGVVWLVAGALLIGIGALGRRGTLPRQLWAGIRLPSTLRSDQSWYAAHRAAGPWLMVGGTSALLLGVGLLIWRPPAGTAKTASLLGVGWLLAWVGDAGFVGARGAKGDLRR